jgi:hypothetical protein
MNLKKYYGSNLGVFPWKTLNPVFNLFNMIKRKEIEVTCVPNFSLTNCLVYVG